MNAAQDHILIELPIPVLGGQVILAALALLAASGLAYLMLSAGSGREARRDGPTDALKAFAMVFAPIWVLILGGTLWHLRLLYTGQETDLTRAMGPGIGALVAALLGAPFVVWGTVIKHMSYKLELRKADFDRERGYSDRIAEMAEMLSVTKPHVVGDTTSEIPDVQKRIAALSWLERFAQDSTR